MRTTALIAALLLAGGGVAAQERDRSYPPRIEGARVETYKSAGDTKLNLYVLAPATPASNRPAIVFFFGGGWSSGTPAQFVPQCRHLAGRGMVAIAADYRVKSRHGAKPTQCLADARSAIRWVRTHAAALGVDPQRIAAGGGSAGGHLAAATAFIEEFDESGEDRSISARPDALVLFNPALVLAALPEYRPEGFGTQLSADRLGAPGERVSPAHHVTSNAPPTIVFHGRADTTVPFRSAEVFAQRMKAAGNRCELVGFAGQPHGFFNREPYLAQTLEQADRFLVSLGWLPAPP
jgi:acetyl esterase